MTQAGCADPFWLRHWGLVDVFVYFSHHLVTIPPPGWTNAAHRNGVPVLGTLITEWETGSRCCSALFCSQQAASKGAAQLAHVARHHGFDGWLVNIESRVCSAYVPHIIHFLRQLRAAGLRVIWYDAVTTSGKLCYQNALTPYNEPFFAAAGELFVNYRWAHGSATPRICANRAAAIGAKAADVYMGIDVFGRGTYGGGQWNCGPAAALALQAGVSAALFAPGWVHESAGGDSAAAAGHDSFGERNEKFWASLRQHWGTPQQRAARLAALPLASSFNQGFGRHFRLRGAKAGGAWGHRSLQSLQPLCQDKADAGASQKHFKVIENLSF